MRVLYLRVWAIQISNPNEFNLYSLNDDEENPVVILAQTCRSCFPSSEPESVLSYRWNRNVGSKCVAANLETQGFNHYSLNDYDEIPPHVIQAQIFLSCFPSSGP